MIDKLNEVKLYNNILTKQVLLFINNLDIDKSQ